MAVEHEPMGQ